MRRVLTTILLAALTVTAANWAVFRADRMNTGRLDVAGPTEGKSAWTFTANGGLTGSPVVGADGTVYIAALDSTLYALGKDGAARWQFKLPTPGFGTPAVSADRVYVGADKLYALDLTGNKVWEAVVADPLGEASPALGPDGVIYIGSTGPALYAFAADGKEKWRFKTDDAVASTPALDASGNLYFGSSDLGIYSATAAGKRRFRTETRWAVLTSPALTPEGLVVAGSLDSCLYCLAGNGSIKWKFKTGGWVTSSAALGADGTVYVGSLDGCVYAIAPDGSQKWSFAAGAPVVASPAVDNQGTVYIGARNGQFYALNPDGTVRWSFAADGPIITSAALDAGAAYFGTEKGTIYCLK